MDPIQKEQQPEQQQEEQEQQEKKELVKRNSYVALSFYVTYVLLVTTGTITFIEALRTPLPAVRHVMNLETCISIVAGYFYSVFMSKIDEYQKKGVTIHWAEFSIMRYLDWAITTPLMLLVLCLITGGASVRLPVLLLIWFLDLTMLYIGYLGEIGVIMRFWAMVGGFVPFAAMMYVIYIHFIRPKYKFANLVLFLVYLVVWSLYGVCYLLSDENRNTALNVLDCFSKCMVGLGIWAYYTHVIRT